MKNVKTYENFKKLIGGSKLVFAGAGLGATILMAGCSGCSVEPEPASEVVIETSETPTEIEVIETNKTGSGEPVFYLLSYGDIGNACHDGLQCIRNDLRPDKSGKTEEMVEQQNNGCQQDHMSYEG